MKTAKKAVKKEVAKKAPAKKAVVKKPRARNNHKVGAATTAAVLGLAATPAKRAAQKRKETKLATGGKWGKQKQLLLGLRDRLTDNFDRDFNLSLLSADQDVIYEIEEALKRIERGTYGMCEITGKAIPQTRLNAIPWARFRVDAQTELEQHGILQNRSLGQLGTITSPAASTKGRTEKELPETKTKKD